MPKQANITIKFDKQRNRWKLDASREYSPTHTRIRKWFAKEIEAKAHKKKLEAERTNHGRSGMILPPDVATDAAKAVEILKPYGASLSAAARFYAHDQEQRRKSCTFAELYDAYVMNPKKVRREKTLRNYRDSYKHFEDLFGDRMVSEIKPAEIERHLDTFTPEFARNHFIALRAWFNFGIRQGWLAENPILSIEPAQREIREIHTLTNAEVRRLLKAAAEVEKYPQLVAYAALGIFCGIRPAELRRLRWEDLNIADGYVTVTATSSKVKKRRNVMICEALKWWLKPVAKETGLVVDLTPTTFKRRWKECRETAKLFDGWPHDVLRHTFCSNHLAAHSNLAELMIETGHGDVSMLREHYLSAIPKKSALAFWQIVPKGAPKPRSIKAA